MKNKSFGITDGVSSHTPFHQVHQAMSGEIVNELNSPICTVEIDDVPSKTQKDNAEVIMRCLNNHDSMLSALEKCVAAINDEISAAGKDEVNENPILKHHAQVAKHAEAVIRKAKGQ